MADPNAVSQVIVRGAQGARAVQAEHGGSAFDVWTRTGEGQAGAAGQTATLDTMPDAPIESGTSVGALPTAMSQQVDALKQAAADVGKAKGALATAGAVMGTLTTLEQAISTPLSAIPFPAYPAIRVMDMDVGLPHAHSHPPNLVPPAPPVPLPSTGPVIPIPYVSGAATVLINGMPAGRCGDMGMGIWCGSYFPMYEIFLGSSSVWIEGMRAARLGVDITKHCIFSNPKPQDLPIGPMIGMTISSSANVVIGGVPMPSLTNIAIGAGIKALSKGLGKIVGLARRAASPATMTFRRGARAAARTQPVTLKRLKMLLGHAGIDHRRFNLQRVTRVAGDDLDNVFGFVGRDGAGNITRDIKGRPIINFTDKGLSSMEEAVKTYGHEAKHLQDFLAGMTTSSEALAERAGEDLWGKISRTLPES